MKIQGGIEFLNKIYPKGFFFFFFTYKYIFKYDANSALNLPDKVRITLGKFLKFNHYYERSTPVK